MREPTRYRGGYGGRLNVFDLTASIVEQARYEWQAPRREDYVIVCFGEDDKDREQLMGFEPCEHRWSCYPDGKNKSRRSDRFRHCNRRVHLLRNELREFFYSEWFEFLLLGLDPAGVRKEIGVPECLPMSQQAHAPQKERE